MKYEHLIQVNDPNDPAIEPLTRMQLWNGLVARAENPGEFVYGLDTMRVIKRGPGFIEREMQFGKRVINDRVEFIEQQMTRYRIKSSAEFPASHMSMGIEEPEPAHLFLRCTYETFMLEAAEYEDFVKQAYYEADLDAVSRIRKLAAQGMLD